jgi:hypothetical protein
VLIAESDLGRRLPGEGWCRRWDLNAFPASTASNSIHSITQNTEVEYERGSDEVKAAMEGDPFGRMLSADFITEQREKRGRELDPGSWSQMEAQELLAQMMSGALGAVERALGVDEDAPMTEVA